MKKRWASAILWGVLWVCCLGVSSSSYAASHTWNSQNDWSSGSASKVTWSKVPGQIQQIYDPSTIIQTPFIYIPNSNLNTVVQMDTRTGQIRWTFDLTPLNRGSNPSRTTVDSNGNVWVGLRNGSYVVALSSKGKYLASVNVGTGPRAIAIDRDGHIWAGGVSSSQMVKISGTTFKVLARVRHSGLTPYGAATDSYGNVWVMNRAKNTIAKIDANQNKIVGFYSAYQGYGIAADKVGQVWVASYGGQVVYRYNAKNGALIKSYSLGARGRGVAIDAKNNVWVACSTSSAGGDTRRIVRVVPSTGAVNVFTNVGLHTIGIAVDSAGYVWANAYKEGKAYKLNATNSKFPVGNSIATYYTCDYTGTRPCAHGNCSPCSISSGNSTARPYTYSDMTGFQLQTIPSKGHWRAPYDAKCKASFQSLSWKGTSPPDTTVQVRARTASTKAGLASASWGPYVAKGQPLKVPSNRWIELEFYFYTKDSRKTATVTEATLVWNYFPETCNNIDDNCDGAVDENWPAKGDPCTVGVGECKNRGKQVCNSQENGLTCSVSPKPAQHEQCDGKDNDCDGKIDENWPDKGNACTVGVGECKNRGKQVCKSDGSGLKCSASPLAPQPEVCDGKDNNCNGKIDENWPDKGKACTVGVGECKNRGKKVCKSDGSGLKCSVSPLAPQPEVCDGKDNDCDGSIDENLTRSCKTACETGMQLCQKGQWNSCSARKPVQEKCNGLDDNCDGKVDNNLQRKCSTACGDGKETCVRGRWDFCDAPQPEAEVCDGKDNDCNGKTDDGIPPRSCQGACGQGTAVCQNGKWSGCSGPQPEPEKCDGKDNDCDGKIDNGLQRKCSTACGDGKETCVGGQWTGCSAPTPQPEICDGKDNDCDGKPDNGAKCPTGTVCKDGACRPLCDNGECPKGMQCVDGICIGDPCKYVTCQKGQKCVGGQCIGLCDTINCPSGEVCINGLCVKNDCYVKGCPAGKICVKGQCVADPCASQKCPADSFCRDGQCVKSCAEVQCKKNEKCVDGKCEADPCSKIKCPAGKICSGGKCVSDPCQGVVCPPGRICKDGDCEHDPCLNIKCPSGQQCKEGQCLDPSSLEPTTPQDEDPLNPKNDGGTGKNGGDKSGGTHQDTPPGEISGRFVGCSCQLPHNSPTNALLFFAFLSLFLFVLPRKRG